MLSWQPFLWLGALSPAIYYVHNNWLEDLMIINTLAGEPVNLLSLPAFLIMMAGVLPVALLYQRISSISKKMKSQSQNGK